jgi:CTP:molybdopterin cytidylyltransferase MocA
VSRELWAEIVSIQDGTMRDFMNAHTKDIEYVNLDTPSILQDLDTPEDYLKYKPPM